MSVRVDPITNTGAFDTERYEQENYNELKESILKYIYLEGFNTTPGEYNVCLLDLNWYIKVQ